MKKILTILIAGGLLLAVVFLLLPRFIDTESITQTFVNETQNATGRSVTVASNSALSLLPQPHVLLNKVEIKNMAGGAAENVVEAEQVILNISLASLFSSQKQISKAVLLSPHIALEKLPDGNMNWNAANITSGIAGLMGGIGALEIKEGKLSYVDYQVKKEQILEHLALKISGEQGQLQLLGAFNIQGMAVNLEGAMGTGTGAAPVSIALNSADTHFSYTGQLSSFGPDADINGKVSFETANLWPWLTLFVKDPEKKTSLQANPPLPLKVSADINKSLHKITISNVTLENTETTGQIDIAATWETEIPEITIKSRFSSFNLDDFYRVLAIYNPAQALASSQIILGEQENAGVAAPTGSNLFKRLVMSLEFAADKVLYRGKTIENASVTADISQGEIVVSQANGSLAGQTQLLSFGIIKQGYQGLSFEGEVDFKGNDLRALLSTADASYQYLPDTGFKAFHARANVYISPVEARVSEASLETEQTQAAGAIIFYYDKEVPRIEAALGLQNVDFNALVSAWQNNKKAKEAALATADATAATAKPASANLDWLKSWNGTFNANLRLGTFLYKTYTGKSATFQLRIARNQLSLDNIAAEYDAMRVTGRFGLDATRSIPSISTVLTLNNADAKYLFDDLSQFTPTLPEDAAVAATAKPSRWSRNKILFPYFEYFNGEFDLTMSPFRYKDNQFDNVKVAAQLQDGVLKVSSLTAGVVGGQMKASGSLNGGAVPGFTINFNITDADIAKLLAVATPYKNFTGRAGISGNLSTSGINYYSWVSNMQGVISIAARDIAASGFDITSITRAIFSVRSVADIVNVTRLAFTGGRTDFSRMDGTFNIESGIMKAAGVSLQSDVAAASLDGQVDFPEWTLDLSTVFQFNRLGTKEVPTLTVRTTGSVDDPKISMDTKLLEAFVAKLATEKILRDAPTGQ